MNKEAMNGDQNVELAVSTSEAETSVPPISPEQEMINQRNLVRREEQEALKRENERQEACVKVVGEQFGYYGLLSLAYGIIYSLRPYKNTSGILALVSTAVNYGMAYLILKKINMPIKKWSYYLAVLSPLINIFTCRTTSYFFIFFNKQAVLLL